MVVSSIGVPLLREPTFLTGRWVNLPASVCTDCTTYTEHDSSQCVCPQVSALAAEVGEVQRERDLVTHTLTDTTAQLQLLTTQNEVC